MMIEEFKIELSEIYKKLLKDQEILVHDFMKIRDDNLGELYEN